MKSEVSNHSFPNSYLNADLTVRVLAGITTNIFPKHAVEINLAINPMSSVQESNPGK